VAGVGGAYFTLLLVWWVLVGRASYRGRFWHVLPLAVNGLGMLGSVGFVLLMAFELDTWCPLCLAAHGFNALLMVVNVLLWPVRSAGYAGVGSGDGLGPTPNRDSESLDRPLDGSAGASPSLRRQTVHGEASAGHPSMRLALAAVAVGVLIVGVGNQGRQLKRLAGERQRMIAIIQQVQQNAETLVTMHRSGPVVDLHIRQDDPIRFDGPDRPTLVIWSDFECTHCRKFEYDLEREYLKSFGGWLRVVFRHYPLSPSCNAYARVQSHPYSCKAAMMAEAARMLGGNEAFWKAHDLLFRSQEWLGEIEPGAFAGELGLDADEFVAVMRSETVGQRIREDVELGRAAGVTATPAVYLEGRRVDGIVRGVPSFWSLMAGVLRSENRRNHPTQ